MLHGLLSGPGPLLASSLVEQALTGVPTWVTYLAVFSLPFLEASIFLGFVVPGETAVLLGGVLASQGRASLLTVAILSTVGAIAGDTVGYAVGRRFGPRLKASRLGQVVGAPRWASGETFLRTRGGPAVLLGRFTALLRALVPTAAGMARLPYRVFAFWNALGGTLWAVGFTFVGYLAGRSYSAVAGTVGRVGLALTAAVVAALLLRHFRRRRASGVTSDR